jgi:hypothetical protein
VEALEGGAVPWPPRRLHERRPVPAQTQPTEIILGGGNELRSAAIPVEVVVAQQEPPARGPRPPVRLPESARVAEV